MHHSPSTSFLAVQDLHFAYDTATKPLFHKLSFEINPGWTGLCGANGCGKTTLLQLIAGTLEYTSGSIRCPSSVLLCEQRTDQLPDQAHAFLEDYDALSYQIRGSLGIDDDWADRWHTLSHGERKRLQIGVALWMEPELLLLDEPTNHLDEDGLNSVFQALIRFKGVGMLVTHDRSLLDRLCSQCLWFESGHDPVLCPGGYSSGRKTLENERLERMRSLERMKKEEQRLQRTAAHYRYEAGRADQKRSNRGIDPGDADARSKRNLAKVTGKDAVDGKRLRQMEGRLRQLEAQKDSVHISRAWKKGITINARLSNRNLVFSAPEQALALGEDSSLALPRIELHPRDQLTLRGPNGSGKSSLIAWISQHHTLNAHEVFYLSQEIPAETASSLLRKVKEMDTTQLGNLMKWVRRLGSEPGRLLESILPSPGEVRKLQLAIGFTQQPAFLLLDEPTNHLDLPSIECLDQALQEYPAGFLLISHDQLFTEALNCDVWRIKKLHPNSYQLMTSGN